MTLRLTAPWVLPIDAAPIADGAVLVDDHGRIAAVGADAAVPRPPDARQQHLAGAALLPGLVNTHTHLELTGFAGMDEEPEFWDWIKRIIALKAGRTDEDFFFAAQRGIESFWAAGVTTVCDCGSTGAVIAALASRRASGIAHHEVFDFGASDVDATMRRFSRELDGLAHHATGRVTLGISPHAPYTVSGPVYRASCELARAHGAPIAVHVAEPDAETALLRDFTGVFAEAWQARGIPRPSPQPVSPIAWLERHDVLSPRTLCIHAIHVDAADADLMQRHGSAVAHCPRSNRRHHLADAPVGLYLDRQLRLGLGTDSEVSVAPPDLIAEARAARTLTGWSARDTVRALTLGGAEALGIAGDIGSLTRGKWGDLVAIQVGETTTPEEAVVASRRGDVMVTWLAGRATGAPRP